MAIQYYSIGPWSVCWRCWLSDAMAAKMPVVVVPENVDELLVLVVVVVGAHDL